MTDVAPVTTPSAHSHAIIECTLDEAIEKAERVYEALMADGQVALAADAFYALTYLKHERGDDGEIAPNDPCTRRTKRA